MNPLKSYAKCGVNTYIHIYVYFLRRMSLTLIKILKRFNAIKYNYVVSG